MRPRLLLIPRVDDYENFVIDMGNVFKVAGECPHFAKLHEFMASEWHTHPETKGLGPYYKCLRCEARGGTGIHYEYGDHHQWHKLGVHCGICGVIHNTFNVPSSHRISPEPLFDELMVETGVKCEPDWTGPRTRQFLGYLCPPCAIEQRRDNRTAHIGQKKAGAA